MKDFVIKELALKNFKGQSRTFTPNKLRTFVKGANGGRKNNVIQSFLLASYVIH